MQLRKHLVTASYVDDTMAKLDEQSKISGVKILCEMGLDPGIGTSDSEKLHAYHFYDFSHVDKMQAYYLELENMSSSWHASNFSLLGDLYWYKV